MKKTLRLATGIFLFGWLFSINALADETAPELIMAKLMPNDVFMEYPKNWNDPY